MKLSQDIQVFVFQLEFLKLITKKKVHFERICRPLNCGHGAGTGGGNRQADNWRHPFIIFFSSAPESEQRPATLTPQQNFLCAVDKGHVVAVMSHSKSIRLLAAFQELALHCLISNGQ